MKLYWIQHWLRFKSIPRTFVFVCFLTNQIRSGNRKSNRASSHETFWKSAENLFIFSTIVFVLRYEFWCKETCCLRFSALWCVFRFYCNWFCDSRREFVFVVICNCIINQVLIYIREKENSRRKTSNIKCPFAWYYNDPFDNFVIHLV